MFGKGCRWDMVPILWRYKHGQLELPTQQSLESSDKDYSASGWPLGVPGVTILTAEVGRPIEFWVVPFHGLGSELRVKKASWA